MGKLIARVEYISNLILSCMQAVQLTSLVFTTSALVAAAVLKLYYLIGVEALFLVGVISGFVATTEAKYRALASVRNDEESVEESRRLLSRVKEVFQEDEGEGYITRRAVIRMLNFCFWLAALQMIYLTGCFIFSLLSDSATMMPLSELIIPYVTTKGDKFRVIWPFVLSWILRVSTSYVIMQGCNKLVAAMTWIHHYRTVVLPALFQKEELSNNESTNEGMMKKPTKEDIDNILAGGP